MKQEENNFLKGVRDGIPICLGYLSVSFAFGIFSVACGLTPFEALLISMTNVTSAGQLAAVPIFLGGTIPELVISQLVINLRYALMSTSLSQKLGGSVRLMDRFLISFVNTDEVFAVASSQPGTVGRRYLYGLILTPYIGWSSGTIIGAAAGSILPAVVTAALGVAIYGMFVAIVLPPAKKDRAVAVCAVIAAVLSCLFRYIPALHAVPDGFVVIICAVIAGTIMAVVAPIPADGAGTEADHG